MKRESTGGPSGKRQSGTGQGLPKLPTAERVLEMLWGHLEGRDHEDVARV